MTIACILQWDYCQLNNLAVMSRKGHTPSLLNHITRNFFSGNLFYWPLGEGSIGKVLNGNPNICSFFLSRFKTVLLKSINDACGVCVVTKDERTRLQCLRVPPGLTPILLSTAHCRVFAEVFRFSLLLLSSYLLLCHWTSFGPKI